MKKQIVKQMLTGVLIFTGIHSPLLAQSIQDLFIPETPITYLGIDFSEARYFGDPGTLNREEIKEMTLKINYLIIAEPDKYDLRRTFSKYTVHPKVGLTTQINDDIDPDKIISYDYADYNRLKAEDIQSMTRNYEVDDSSGVGLVFIMEGMNKTAEEAAMWVTFFNMADGTVLLTRRLKGRAFGITFRNHWAGAVYDIMKEIDKREFKRWKKQYVN